MRCTREAQPDDAHTRVMLCPGRIRHCGVSGEWTDGPNERMSATDDSAWRGAGGGGAPVEVLVFINDEEDATEECFRVRVNANL